MTLTRQLLSRRYRALLCLGAAVAVSGLSGCSLAGGSGGTEIRLEPTGRYIIYNQEFVAAWCQVNADGEYDMVLVNTPQPSADEPGRPLLPAAQGNPLQVMHVHVAWRPSTAVKPNFPAATNASINWYVVDNHDPHNPQYLHYQGAGLVRVDSGDDETTFDIQPTLISLHHRQGGLRDPIGPSLLSGEIKAGNARQKTMDVLSGLNEIFRLAPDEAAPSPATEPSGTPPSREQTGP